MNYLAHAHLSAHDPALLSGGILADCIKGRKALEQFPEELRRAIMFHRQVDVWVDSHPLVLQGIRRLYPTQGKYASVIADIYYDHILAWNWDTYSDIDIETFCLKVYPKFSQYSSWYPVEEWEHLMAMIRHNWLQRYDSEEALRFTFKKMAERVRFPSNIEHATDELMLYYKEYEVEFNEFYPLLLEASSKEDFIPSL